MGDPESSSEKHLGQRIIDQNFGSPGGLILDPYPYYMSIYQYYYIKMLNTFFKKYVFFSMYLYVYVYIYMIIYVCAGKWYIIFIWPINPIQSIAISTPIKSNPWITEWMNEWMNESINQSPNQSFTHSILTQLVMLLIPAKDWKVTPGWKSHSPIVTVYYWDDYPPIHSPGANENPDTTVPMVVKSLS